MARSDSWTLARRELIGEGRKALILARKAYGVVQRLIGREESPTMLEYGLLIGLIALVVSIAAAFLGQAVSTFFSDVGTSVT